MFSSATASAGSAQAGGSLQRAAPGVVSRPRLLARCKDPVVSPLPCFIVSVCSALSSTALAPRGLAAAVYSVQDRMTVIGVAHEHVPDSSWNDSLCSDLTTSHLPLCSVTKAAERDDG